MDQIEHQTAGRTAPSIIERRRHQRVSVAWMATLKSSRGIHECMVIDVSLGGAKLTFVAPPLLPPGAPATLDIGPRGKLRAQAVWQRGSFLGLCFTDAPAAIAGALKGAVPA